LPLWVRYPSKPTRHLTQKFNRPVGRPIGKCRRDCERPSTHVRCLELAEQRWGGPQIGQGGDVIRLAEAVRRDELQTQPSPCRQVRDRKNREDLRAVLKELDPQGIVALREVGTDLGPYWQYINPAHWTTRPACRSASSAIDASCS